ncbi:sensor histidine kinase [Bailinhaonella thermotolerans]|uniref:sensor histidine kinase n=1 Tax=Bailinhaonella thermotolerans TaxID=1070861 RepID=UPI001F5BAF0E|nr:histidine kinase [Bailinhaonella thermotolerans]
MVVLLARRCAGVLLGLVTGVAELALLALAWPWRSRWVPRAVALERRRLAALLGQDGHAGDAGPGYLALRAVVAVLGGYVVLALVTVGTLFVTGAVWATVAGVSSPVTLAFPGIRLITETWAIGLLLGSLSLALGALAGWAVAGAERRLAVRFLGPGSRELMRRRIAELTATRRGVLRAVDEERRRIERDLHDGVQQRGVALSMLLGRARHDPAAAADLLEQAYGESRRLLDELRSVAWRVYPTALDELGLRAALLGMAEGAGAPVSVHYGLSGRPESEVETVLYFAAREAVTNAVKHARARDILIVLTEDERTVRMVVSDDGAGGADPAGGGLSGLARRVEALDGVFEVSSPPGGGTRVSVTLPREPSCA